MMRLRLFMCVGLVICAAAFLFAQTGGSGTLHLQFMNSRTGEAVIPDTLLVDGQKQEKTAESGGVLSLTLPNGQHEIEVQSEGYVPLITTTVVDGKNTLTNTFELDPAATTDEPQPEINARTAVLAGHVVDAVTGRMIPQVEVAAPEKQTVTRTDEKGRFTLSISVPEGTTENPVTLKVDIVLSKDGYVTEQRKNIELVSGNQRETSYRMDPISPDSEVRQKVIDESAEREQSPRLFSWVYDVSFD